MKSCSRNKHTLFRQINSKKRERIVNGVIIMNHTPFVYHNFATRSNRGLECGVIFKQICTTPLPGDGHL